MGTLATIVIATVAGYVLVSLFTHLINGVVLMLDNMTDRED